MEGVCLAIFFTAGWVVLFRYRIEKQSDALPHYEGLERLWVRGVPVFLGLYVSAVCLVLNFVLVPWFRAVGAAAIFSGALGFWFFARAQIAPFDETTLPDEPPRNFRCDGAFGVVRHPLYFSYLVACAAPLVAVPSLWLALGFAGCAAGLGARAIQEERRLRAQLGPAYEEYCSGVKRLVPFVW